MESISFRTPLYYNNNGIIFRLAEFVDNCIPFRGNKVAYLKQREIQGDIKNVYYYKDVPKENLLKTVGKIALCCTIIFVAILIAAKYVLRKICTSRIAPIIPSSSLQKAYGFHLAPELSDNLEVSDGYGEWIIRYGNNPLRQIDQKTYAAASIILRAHSPLVWEGDSSKRVSSMKDRLKHRDPDLEATFIPRSLYEMVFIRESIEEDVQKVKRGELNKGECLESTKNTWTQIVSEDELNGLDSETKKKEFGVLTNPITIHNNVIRPRARKKLSELAYRLNKVFSDILREHSYHQEILTYAQVRELANEQIDYLRKFYDAPGAVDSFSTIVNPGGSTTFTGESSRGSVVSMGIANDDIAGIVRKAISIECMPESQGKVILYRGGNLDKDHPESANTGCPYSISIGTSLFAGFVNDTTATAFVYMRQKGVDAYALRVNPRDNDSPFFIPKEGILEQFFGTGEHFHARSKVWNISQKTRVGGFNCGTSRKRVHADVVSDCTKDILCQKFDRFLNKNIFLLKDSKDIGIVGDISRD